MELERLPGENERLPKEAESGAAASTYVAENLTHLEDVNHLDE